MMKEGRPNTNYPQHHGGNFDDNDDNNNAQKVALKWFLQNACSSNVQHAIISNVCRRWRDVASTAVVSEAMIDLALNDNYADAENEGEDGNSVKNECKRNVGGSNNNGSNALTSYSTLRGLLITEMARELRLAIQEQQSQISSVKKQNELNPTSSYCLAWFAPSGIQTTSISLNDDNELSPNKSSEHLDNNFRMHSNGRGRTLHNGTNAPTNNNSRSVTCCKEWRGYRHATEVLIPFGYSTYFVMGVMDAVSKSLGDTSSAAAISVKDEKLTRQQSINSRWQQQLQKSHQYNPTYAVRGATLARPEGYCLCLDDDYIEHFYASNNKNNTTNNIRDKNDISSSSFQMPPHAANCVVPSCIDEWMNDHDEDNAWPLNKKVGLSPAQRKRKQTNLAKALLPRMVLSTRRKYPLLHRLEEEEIMIKEMNEASAAATSGNEKVERPAQQRRQQQQQQNQRSLPFERRQRSVQFLNSDRSQAVKLITPQFHCGPISGPITAFLVAITTEDGCFFSGRHSRFEFGHLYPLCSRDMQNDMSPVCIATGKKKLTADGATVNAADHSGRSISKTNNDTSSGEDEAVDDDVGSTNSSSDEDSDRSTHCLCKFDSGDPFHPKDHNSRSSDDDDDDEDPTEDCVHRGCTGPGLWHVYTAVFDGKDSVIRVDGCEEPKRTREHYGLTSLQEEEDCDNPVNAGKFVGSGTLDGLSIGSDHQFDMSLCYGEIDGECGQGAISELVLFKGRLEDGDIQQIEKHLMKKHGILSVNEKQELISQQNQQRNDARRPLIHSDCHIQEDEWRRQAHALIEQRRKPWDVEGQNLPLRVVANHTSVAWHRKNDITGAPVRITRIGAKNSNGSSDW